MEEKWLWKFYWSCGRMGSLEGLFVATKEEIDRIIGKKVYFGEVLGKHSEIYGTLDENDIKRIDLDSETVVKVTNLLGDTWSGYNLLEYIDEDN
jgi:hypothetical protein